MAQWSRADRTLYAKLVYYGPAFGGKTTNLQTLHRMTDPRGEHRLLSVKTADDRTLFFDLLPFELGNILGYQVAMKLFTVPGQVRYDTTRQVVLAGADAVVFVADSSVSRRDQNVWSLQNLQMNMRAKGLDPKRVPILFQFNKQDVGEAAAPEEVASWLGADVDRGFPAVATEGRGVLETFIAACGKMLGRIVESADDRTRRSIDREELERQVAHGFEPHLARAGLHRDRPAAEAEQTQIVVEGEDVLAKAVHTGVELGERLSNESALAQRLEREAEAFRQLSESLRSVGSTFERGRIADAALGAAGGVLEASVVSLVRNAPEGSWVTERSWGAVADPLTEVDGGRALLDKLNAAGGACVIEDLAAECGPGGLAAVGGLRALAAVPLQDDAERRRLLLAYAPPPDGEFMQGDVRFLATVAGHLTAGLEKARLHEELTRRRERLEETVAGRTRQLREALESLRSVDRTKDRFLGNLSHEMKSPLTAILTSATVLRDYRSTVKERKGLIESIVESAERMRVLLEDLFQLANRESGGAPLRLAEYAPDRVLEEALDLVGRPEVQCEIRELTSPLRFDLDRVARALANLIDNAIKFSSPDAEVRVVVQPYLLRARGRPPVEAVALSVLDRGPGVPEEDRERIFLPFEQGGDSLRGKPAGVGLGLHEAREIARSHCGLLEYDAREGGGSELRLVIPVQPADQARLLEAVGG